MNRRDFLKATAGVTMAWSPLASQVAAGRAEPRLNVLFVTVDDWRAEAGRSN